MSVSGVGSPSLGSLQDVIFAEMRALQGIDPKDGESMRAAVARAEAIKGLAGAAIANAQTAMRVVQMQRELRAGTGDGSVPPMLGA